MVQSVGRHFIGCLPSNQNVWVDGEHYGRAATIQSEHVGGRRALRQACYHPIRTCGCRGTAGCPVVEVIDNGQAALADIILFSLQGDSHDLKLQYCSGMKIETPFKLVCAGVD